MANEIIIINKNSNYNFLKKSINQKNILKILKIFVYN